MSYVTFERQYQAVVALDQRQDARLQWQLALRLDVCAHVRQRPQVAHSGARGVRRRRGGARAGPTEPRELVQLRRQSGEGERRRSGCRRRVCAALLLLRVEREEAGHIQRRLRRLLRLSRRVRLLRVDPHRQVLGWSGPLHNDRKTLTNDKMYSYMIITSALHMRMHKYRT